MISPTIHFLTDEYAFHATIDDQAAKTKLIRYATAFCTFRTYNCYVIYQNDLSNDYAILKIYNAVINQFENHLITYSQANRHILLRTPGSANSRVFNSITDMIKELNKPLLEQITRIDFRGSTLIGIHWKCLEEPNGRSERLLASVRPGASIDTLIGGAVATPAAASIASPVISTTVAASVSSPATPPAAVVRIHSIVPVTRSTIAVKAKPSPIADAEAMIEEIQRKIEDSEVGIQKLVINQQMVIKHPHYTKETKEALEKEWSETPGGFHYAFREGATLRTFICSLSIAGQPIKHYEFEVISTGFKLNESLTVPTLGDVMKSFTHAANLKKFK